MRSISSIFELASRSVPERDHVATVASLGCAPGTSAMSPPRALARG
jgi:hypothetical protein